MGGLTRALFGGSKQKSSSDNQAYGTLSKMLTGNIGQGNAAMSTLGSLLGIGDPGSGKAALDNFLDSTGFKFLMDSGSKAITGNAAARGLLNSGFTGKRLTQFGQDLGLTKVGELMDRLTSLGQYGLNSANTVASAGGRSTSTGKSSPGIFNSLFPGGLSDRRTKRKIVKLGEFLDGLGYYEYEYIFAPGKRFRGVMADEVKKIRPWAMGPEIGSARYMTVEYSKLGVTELVSGPISMMEAV